MTTGKPRIISKSGKDVTGTSAASSERRKASSSSSKKKNSSVSPAARKGYSRSKKRDDSKKKESSKKKSSSSKKKDTSVSPAAKKGYSTSKKKTSVRESVKESAKKGERFEPAEKKKELPDKFDLKRSNEYNKRTTYRGTQLYTPGIQKQQLEQQRQKERAEGAQAMQLTGKQKRRSTLRSGPQPALVQARTKKPEWEQTARAYESKVESTFKPATRSDNPYLRFAGSGAEVIALTPTALPRLAVGMARNPTATTRETVLGQAETVQRDPARGLGQIAGMAVGGKVLKGAGRAKEAVPYRIVRNTREPGILIKGEVPVKPASQTPTGPKQYTIPTKESAPKGLPEAAQGKLKGSTRQPPKQEPGTFIGKETQPGMAEFYAKATPKQFEAASKRFVFEDKGAGKPVSTEYGSYRVFEPIGKRSQGTPTNKQLLQPPETTGRNLPFRIERRQQLTPVEMGFTRGRTQPGNVVSTTAREVNLIDRTGKKSFFFDDTAQLKPTRAKTAEVNPEFMRIPETAYRRKGGRVAVRGRTTDPIKTDLQNLLKQSERMNKPGLGKRAYARPTVKPKGRSAMFPLPFARGQTVPGIRNQPYAIPKPPTSKPQSRNKPLVSTRTATSSSSATQPKTTAFRKSPILPRALPKEPPIPREQRKKKTKRPFGSTPGFEQFKKKWRNPTATGYDILKRR